VNIESESGITTRLDNLISDRNRVQQKKGKEAKTDRETRSGIEQALEEAKSKLETLEVRKTILSNSLKTTIDYSNQIKNLKRKLDELDAEMGVYVA
jgi:predicted nuclease with TOPRIM domain